MSDRLPAGEVRNVEFVGDRGLDGLPDESQQGTAYLAGIPSRGTCRLLGRNAAMARPWEGEFWEPSGGTGLGSNATSSVRSSWISPHLELPALPLTGLTPALPPGAGMQSSTDSLQKAPTPTPDLHGSTSL